MSIIIGLILLGLVFISFEIVVPGGILGILGGLSIIAACALAYQEYGMLGATGIFIGSLVLVSVTLIVELKFLPKTEIGKRMFLKETVETHSTKVLGAEDLVGKEGEAMTMMAPTGRIVVCGEEFEGFSQDGLIKQGEKVSVVGRDNFRILVKKTTT